MLTDDLQPKLPPEIEELIFSIALQSDIRECVNLTLVAKRIYEWLRRHLYKIAIIHDIVPRGRPRFDITLLKAQGRYIRHFLCWVPGLHGDQKHLNDLVACLSLCPNLVNLAIWHPDVVYDEKMVDILLGFSLILLSFDITLFHSHLKKYSVTTHVSFISVTHLLLIGRYIALEMDNIVEYFPSVTHIALNEMRAPGLSPKSILDGWKDQLQVLVSLVNRREMDDDYSHPNDARVILVAQGTAFVEEWQEAAEDEPESIWRVAEREVQLRREKADIDWRRVINMRDG